MARSENDSWDVASSVGATATLVAAARAMATRRHDPLVDDPFAEPLVRAVGIEAFTRALDGEIDVAGPGPEGADARLLQDVIAVRTWFFDDFFRSAATPQAVILAAGLDSRAYRLPWARGTTVYEIDQAEVLAFKDRVLSDLGAAPATGRRTVAVDLRDDWPAALRAAGFDDTRPTSWSAEGLLVYLPPDAQDRLFDHIDALSAPGSRLATEYHPDGGAGIAERASAMSSHWAQHGLDLNLGELFYPGERRSVVEYLEALGWTVSVRSRPEMFAALGRPYPDGEATAMLRKSLSVTAIKE